MAQVPNHSHTFPIPTASQAQAEVGTDDTVVMTPLTTAQAVAFQLPSTPLGKSLLNGVSAEAIRTILDAQEQSPGLDSIGGLTTAADQMLYTTGADTYAVTGLSAFSRTVLDDADATAWRTTLGLGTAATTDASAYATAAQGATADAAMQPATYDPNARETDAFDSANQYFTSTKALTSPRVVRDRLEDIPSVKDWGALGDGVNSDLSSFNNALAQNGMVIVPPGNYVLDGALLINDFNVLSGLSSFTAGDTTGAPTATSRLIFTHASGACFSPADALTSLNHTGMENLTIRVEGSADWIWDYKTVVGLKLTNVRANTVSDATGGFRSVKIDPSDFSWVPHFTNLQIRLTDAAVNYSLDTDMSDGSIMGCALTGGKGAILRGTGGIKLLGTRVDRSNGYGVTISNETESQSQHSVVACQIEANTLGGVLVDGDADDTLTSTVCCPIIVGNQFRSNGSTGDIIFKNDTGPALRGGTVGPNSHTTPILVTPVVVPSTWTDIVINASHRSAEAAVAPRSYLGNVFPQPSFVLAQGTGSSVTGTTAETTLASVTIPAGAMGSTGSVRVTSTWSHTNNGNNKNLRVKFGGTGGTLFTSVPVSTQATSRLVTEIRNTATSAQVGAPANFIGIGSSTGAITTSSVDTATDVSLLIRGALANAADTITLESYLVEIFPSW